MAILAPKPCLVCGRLSAGPRCPRCTTTQTAHREARKAQARATRLSTGDGAARRLRRTLNYLGQSHCSVCMGYFSARDLDVDHTIPLVDGGLDTDLNVQALCSTCHRAKTAREAHQRPLRPRRPL